MDEGRLHTAAWRAAVERARRELAMPEAGEDEMDAWIARTGPQRVLAVAAEAFESLRTPQGHVPARYLSYFLGCMLAHHGGGTVPHTAPAALLEVDPPFHTLLRRLDYYLLWYVPYAPPAEGHRWSLMGPPAGFEVHWPKSDWCPRHGPDPDPEQRRAWERRFVAVKKELLAAAPEAWRNKVALMQYLLPGRRYQTQNGQWWDEPVRITTAQPTIRFRVGTEPRAEAPLVSGGDRWSRRQGRAEVLLAPVTAEIFVRPGQVALVGGPSPDMALPMPAGPVVPSWTAVLVPSFRDYSYAVQIAGGSVIGDLPDPAVILDPNADEEDREMARLCQVVLTHAWGMRELVWAIGGRPRKGAPVPGQTYLERVRELYATFLRECRDAPDATRRQRLRRRALRQAQREFQAAGHARPPRGWYLDVDEPYRRRRSG